MRRAVRAQMDPWWKWRARSHPVRVCREALVVRKAHEEQLEVMGKELAAWRVHAARRVDG